MGKARQARGPLRIARAARRLTGRWQQVPVEPRGQARLGISFRPLQAQALGLDPTATLATLLDYPFLLIRLGAYWNRIEDGPGRFDTSELDRQVEAAEQAGKQIIVCVGPVKTFGYPEFFVPGHHLPEPLREGALVQPADHQPLLDAAAAFAGRLVQRYRDREAIVAWQVEHDAVDPLGLEHSWRLSAAFVRREVEAVRAADPTRPVLMNGFLPTSAPVRLQQWWRTRDQGDSLLVAQQLADIVGVHLPGDQREPGHRRHEQLAGEVVLPVLDDRDHASRGGLEQAGREHPGEREGHRVKTRDPAHGGLQDAAQAADEQDGKRQVDREPRAVAQQFDHVALGDDRHPPDRVRTRWLRTSERFRTPARSCTWRR